MTILPSRKRCKHSRERLILETPLYGIWQCKTCERRRAAATPQMSLFTFAEAQLLTSVQQELPRTG